MKYLVKSNLKGIQNRNEFFVDKAHLALNDGEMFGKEGIGFMRLNVASPRCIIEKAMKQLADAYQLYIK